MKTLAIAIACFAGLLSSRAEVISPQAIKWALGQIETGADREERTAADCKRGTHKEVSRYQVLPAIWQKYTTSRDYTNPSVAWQVAEQVLIERVARFRQLSGRAPSVFDLYVLWNAPAQYEQVNFRRSLLARTVAERADRFANLAIDFNKDRARLASTL